MTQEQKNNPLHGVKLEALLDELVDNFGWDVLAKEINLNCFKTNPSIKSSLKFLRRTEWAREKVERFYLYDHKKLPRPGNDQYDITPRKRIVSADNKPYRQSVRKPAEENTDKKSSSKEGGFNPWDMSRHNKK